MLGFSAEWHTKIRGPAPPTFHCLARNCPDTFADLTKLYMAKRSRSNAGQDQQSQRQIGDGRFRERGIEGGHALLGHGGRVLGLVPRLAEQRLRFLNRLQVYYETQSCTVPQHDAKAVHCLARCVRLFVPDWQHHVANVALVDLFDRRFAQLRQDVKFKWREPAAGPTVPFQLSFPRFELPLRRSRGAGCRHQKPLGPSPSVP